MPQSDGKSKITGTVAGQALPALAMVLDCSSSASKMAASPQVIHTVAGDIKGRREKGISMKAARAAAVLTWIYAAAFGIPAIPVAVYLQANGILPSFLGLFPMYGGPWSDRYAAGTVTALLVAFDIVLLAVVWAARLLWKGSKAGGVLSLALLPIEAVFWYGFALPVPVLCGLARVGLVVAAWRSLGRKAANTATGTPS